jgi:hypothetical protein
METIKSLRATMVLRAQLPPLAAFPQEVAFAQVVFKGGEMHACAITTADQRRLLSSSQEAFALIDGLGVLVWRRVTQPDWDPPGSVQGSASSGQVKALGGTTGRGIPYKRVASLSAAPVQALPHRHKQVFLLIDGHKDSQQIREVLALTPERVVSVLDELYHLHLIDFQTGNESANRENT